MSLQAYLTCKQDRSYCSVTRVCTSTCGGRAQMQEDMLCLQEMTSASGKAMLAM